MTEDLLSLDLQICHRVYALNNALTRRYRPFLTALKLTYPQYVIMMALWERDDVSIQDLVEKTKMDMGSVSVILKKLSDKRYLRFKVNKEDRRQKFVLLTASGRKLKLKAATVPENMGCLLASVENEELEQLKSILDRLYTDFS